MNDQSTYDTKTLMFYFNQTLFKVKSDLESSIKQYNINKDNTKIEISKTKKQVDQIKDEIINLQENMAGQSTKNDIIMTELSKFKTGFKEEKEDIKTIGFNEDSINMRLSLKIFENKIRSKDYNDINKGYNILKMEIDEILAEMKKELIDKVNKNKSLVEKNNQLKDKYKEMDEVNMKKRFCIHCQIYFIPKFNNEKSCIYHPGRLQYYSCRGCGDDEYYTCCLRCLKCSKGCKYSKHVSEI